MKMDGGQCPPYVTLADVWRAWLLLRPDSAEWYVQSEKAIQQSQWKPAYHLTLLEWLVNQLLVPVHAPGEHAYRVYACMQRVVAQASVDELEAAVEYAKSLLMHTTASMLQSFAENP